MVLLLSFDIFEQGTDPVIDWLLYYKVPFIKLSIKDLAYNQHNTFIDVNTDLIYVNNRPINDLVNVIWYRRFFYDYNLPQTREQFFHDRLDKSLKTELLTLFNYVARIFESKKWMSAHAAHHLNKFQALQEARNAGLNIPVSQITGSKEQLQNFYKQFAKEGIITKAFTDDSKLFYIKKDQAWFSFTKEIKQEDIHCLPNHFFSSLFQEKLNIDYEIRLFYLDGAFYATAIINTEAEQFSDRKLYNKSALTHQVSYILPEQECIKIDKFMRAVNLNCGCIDLARTTAGKYYFIEVNPVGQYLYQSMKCNYCLEEKIASWLKKENEKMNEVSLTK